MGNLLQVAPRSTRITLGGVTYLASEFRVDDRADLEAWIADRVPCPYEVAAPWLEATGERTLNWKLLLHHVVQQQEAWPPDLSSAEAAALCNTPDGMTYFAWLALRREQPRLTQSAVRVILGSTDTGEFARLARVAWATSPTALITELIDGPTPPDPDPKPFDWAKVFNWYARECPGGPPFGELTMTQLGVLLSDGNPGRADEVSGSGDEIDWGKVDGRADFWAPVDEYLAARAADEGVES